MDEIEAAEAACNDVRKNFARVVNCDNPTKSSAMGISISSKVSEPKDECLAFAELVTLKLQKFDEVSRLKVQHQINLVLYDAEMSVLKSESIIFFKLHSKDTVVTNKFHKIFHVRSFKYKIRKFHYESTQYIKTKFIYLDIK